METAEEKITLTKQIKGLAYDITMMSQLKYLVILLETIHPFSFGTLVVMINRFIPYIQGKW